MIHPSLSASSRCKECSLEWLLAVALVRNGRRKVHQRPIHRLERCDIQFLRRIKFGPHHNLPNWRVIRTYDGPGSRLAKIKWGVFFAGEGRLMPSAGRQVASNTRGIHRSLYNIFANRLIYIFTRSLYTIWVHFSDQLSGRPHQQAMSLPKCTARKSNTHENCPRKGELQTRLLHRFLRHRHLKQ